MARAGLQRRRDKGPDRAGRDLAALLPELAGLANALDGRDVVLDGELIAEAGRACDFYRLGPRMATNRARRPAPTTFVAYDVLWLDGASVCRRPYLERRTLLEGLGLDGPRWATVEAFDCEPGDLLAACADLGLEGVVAKRATSPYRPGVRSPDWLKLKTDQWRAVHAERRLPEQRRPARRREGTAPGL